MKSEEFAALLVGLTAITVPVPSAGNGGGGARLVRAAAADPSPGGGGDWRRPDNTEVLKELGVELESKGKRHGQITLPE